MYDQGQHATAVQAGLQPERNERLEGPSGSSLPTRTTVRDDNGDHFKRPLTSVRAWTRRFTTQVLAALAILGFSPHSTAAETMLLIHADSGGDAVVESGLVATGEFTAAQIDSHHLASGLPSLATVSGYDCAVVWTNQIPPDPVGIGDLLKDYVLAGGGVVLTTYALSAPMNPWEVQGGIMEDGFNPLDPSNTALTSFPRALNFSTALLSHPILNGVTDFTYSGNSNFVEVSLDSGAVLVGRDNFGVPLIGVNSLGNVAAFNIWRGFSPSSGVYRAIANACKSVGNVTCRNSSLDPGEECDDGNTANGDGCSSSCQTEPCWACGGEPSVCELAVETRTLDSAGHVGEYSSVAVNSVGQPVISYHDATNTRLKVAVCDDEACSSHTLRIVDSDGDPGRYSSVAIDPSDDLPVISYTKDNVALRIARCNTSDCAGSVTVTEVDNVGSSNNGIENSITMVGGRGLVSYFRAGPSEGLRAIRCDGASCASFSSFGLEGGITNGRSTSIMTGADGFGVIAYRSGGDDLKVIRCTNGNCSATNSPAVVSTDVAVGNSIALGADNRALISYQDSGSQQLRVVHCSDVDCGVTTQTTLDSAATTGSYTALAMDHDQRGLIGYYDATNGNLKVAGCVNTTCNGASLGVIDSGGDVGRYVDVARTPSGMLFSYYDVTNQDLKVAFCGSRCGNGTVTPDEECDDGNLTDGDGCDSNCTATACGNGITTSGEGCDDGNVTSCDGCSAACVDEGSCGDGTVGGCEPCDDGNTVNGDGCSEVCAEESCVAPAASTIAWWTADSTANDVSGNAHHGTLGGSVTYAAGKVGQAFQFTGANNCVSVPDHAAFALGTAPFSIDFWVRFNAAALTSQIFIGQNQATNPFWQLYVNPSGQLSFALNPGSGPDVQLFLHPWAPAASQWYHVAVTRSASDWRLYLNGVQVDTDSYAGAVPNVATILTIGCSTANSINGRLDEVAITGQALSAAEVAAIFSADTGGKCKPCGDGVITAGQECDDGDTVAGDGCDSSCEVEPCHACSGAPSSCTPLPDGTTCSDGNACTAAETCLDGFCQATGGGGGTVLGGQLYASGGPVEVEILPSSAGSDSDLYLFEPGPPVFIATNRDTGTVVNLGSFPPGTELVFGIFVEDSGHTFKMGPASRNPDGLIHAQVDTVSTGVVQVGFEDLFGFADDYNDNVFEFRGGISPTSCDDANPCTADSCDPETGCSVAAHPLGFACADDGVICTSDQCDGAGTCTHPAGNAGAQCRPDAGACDVAETCDGTNSTCPADGFEGSGTPCGNPINDACTDPDTCNGAGACQANHATAGTSCPDDGLVCTADQCDGGGSCLHPAGNAGTECRADTGQCDVAEQCDGSSATCPADGFEASGTGCNDSSVCTQTDQCDGSGSCAGSNPLACDDGDACTANDCDPFNGCENPPALATGCKSAAKAILILKQSGGVGDKQLFKWVNGDILTLADLQDPTTSTEYGICIFEGSSNELLESISVPPGTPNWKAAGSIGYKYKELTGQNSGITKMLFRGNDTAGKSKALVKGKGDNLPDPVIGDMQTPVTVQVINPDTGACVEAVFDSGDVKKNTSTMFKAKAQQ